MNEKMWKNALEGIDEKYIEEAAEYAPEGEKASDSAFVVKDKLRSTAPEKSSGNLWFIFASAAALIACILGINAFAGKMGEEIPVNPLSSSSAQTEASTPETEITTSVISSEEPQQYENQATLTKDGTLIIPENITEIADYAYSRRLDIKKVVLHDKVTRIGKEAFSECNHLEEIVMPEGLKEIGDKAFRICASMKSIDLPEGLEIIGMNAFESSDLREITVPDSVKAIGDMAFSNCQNLKKVVLPKNLTVISAGLLSPNDSLSEVVIPESVTAIKSNAFANCYSLRSLTLPDGIKEIGADAFYRCPNLTITYKGKEYTSEEIAAAVTEEINKQEQTAQLIGYFKEKRASKAEELENLEKYLSSASEQYETVVEAQEDITRLIEELQDEQEKSELQSELEQYETRKAALGDDISEVTAEIEAFNKELAELDKNIAQIELAQNAAELKLVPPVDYPDRITTYYGYDEWRGGSHDGLDYSWEDCYGENIYAVADGTIKTIEAPETADTTGYGNCIIIDHGDGIETLYAKCSRIYVSEGQTVKQGEVIAEIGSTGFSTGPHLHFEITINGERADPQIFFSDYIILGYPVDKGEERITMDFGEYTGHNGVDFSWEGCNGSNIYAAAGGTVIFSEWDDEFGNCIIIDHGAGISTIYAHCSAIYVSDGYSVGKGDVIGSIGSTGLKTGSMLHFEVRRQGTAADPKLYLR